ncbi:MAG: hypothetical protein N2Z69_03455 [Methylophilaceae bacterium]|nr:hypothetical protein [Methylophilaceae bacterium]
MTHAVFRQQGFSLVMAVFLIVVLGGIAVFLGRVVTMQSQESALDEEGMLTYQAARAGVEWGAYQALQAASCAPSTTLTFAGGTVLAKYKVTVTCTASTTHEGTTPVNLYQIVATANNGNAPTGHYYVERQLQATLVK